MLKPDVLNEQTRLAIKGQKFVALDLMNKLKVINPYVILAGGAPRNWFFNRKANDLDFFIHIPSEMQYTAKRMKETLESFGVHEVFNMATHSAYGILRSGKEKEEGYTYRMNDINMVFEGEFEGQTVQIIVTDVSTFGYVESHFDTSINMIYCKGNEMIDMEPRQSQAFYNTFKTGVIAVYPDNTNGTSHLERMGTYFPEASFTLEENMYTILQGVNTYPPYMVTKDVHNIESTKEIPF